VPGEKGTNKAAPETEEKLQPVWMNEPAIPWIRQLRAIDFLIGKVSDFICFFHSHTSCSSLSRHLLKSSKFTLANRTAGMKIK
jgi:hypothetical protein